MMETLTFRDFLLDYMNRHEMKSARELAAFLDMDPSMVSQAISSADPRTPGLKFLTRVSQKTGAPIEQLIRLAYPELASETGLPASTLLLAQQFEQAPEHIQQAIRALLRGR